MAELTSLEKGLSLLRALASSERGLTVAELAHETGLNRTTVYRLSDVLERSDWVISLNEPGEPARLDVGPSIHGLALLVTSKYDADMKLKPIADELSRQLSETVHIGTLEGSQIVHIGRSLPNTGLNMAARIGSRQEAHLTGLGKALLATLSDEEVMRRYPEERLSTHTERSIATRSDLLKELDQIRQRGYSVENEESRAGITCLAAPIFVRGERANLALSVTSMPQRLEGSRFEEAATAVTEAARTATEVFGGQAPAEWR